MKIYSSKGCVYCNKLKEGLKLLNIEYVDIDIDLTENSEECEKIFKLAGEGVIPIIIIKPHVLVPNRSFKTIDEAINLISSLIKK